MRLPALGLAVLIACASLAPAQTSRSGKKNPSRSASRSPFPKWSDLQASSVRLQRGKLLIGLADGGAAIYTEATLTGMNLLKGSGRGPASEVLWEGAHAWWIDQGSGKLMFATTSQRAPGSVALDASGMTEPPRRLSLWQGKVIVQGRAQIRVIDPLTKRADTPEQAFPRDVAVAVQQGTVLSSWRTERDGKGEGQLVVIRRYGSKSPGASGQMRELAAITAWSSTGKNYRALGTYVRPLVGFVDAPGPRVQYTLGRKTVDLPFGACDTGNLQLTEDGLVALDEGVLLTIPIRTKNWLPDEVPVRVPPNFANSVTASTNNAWWTDGSRIYCAAIDSGLTDVYVPRAGAIPIRDLAADDDGVWVVRGTSLRRIRAEQPYADGYVRYPAMDEKLDFTASEAALRKAAMDARSPGAWGMVSESLRAAGWTRRSDLQPNELGKVGREVKGDLAVGDVIVSKGEPALYVGNGEVVTRRLAVSARSALQWAPGTVAYRFLDSARSLAAFRPGAVEPADVDPFVNPGSGGSMGFRVPLLGLGRPNPSLGHDRFVAINIGGRYDRPWLPVHQRLDEEARSWFGTSYVWGGNDRSGVDCSGFVQNVFRACGVNLPRTSALMGQTKLGIVVTDDLRYGDVIVIPGHVLIYAGGGKTYETVRGKGVWTSSISRRGSAIVRRFLLP